MRATPAPASQLEHYVVTDPKGVVSDGSRYPAGTALTAIPGAAGMLKTWMHFGQAGLSPDLQRASALAPSTTL